ncbi:MAG: hypothetical protein LUG16_05665, partial [Candidatus Gastranaerophilales bacterium]|nr:hypothetical protein [Candidatus Gastranaerophilales bacterium]
MYDNTKSLKQSLNTRDFFKFCKKEFSSNMESLEKNRRLCITRFVVVSIILIICITLIFFECKYHYIVYNTIRDLDIEVLYLLPSIPFLAMSFTALFLLYIPKNYKNQSKNLIMGKLLSYIGDFRVDNSSNYK